ncbi:hypothetical protein X797_011737 [Metarhizium robertsii]|uniref:Geranylgeranyl pyrophosphate synthetase n=2 Tax=Metarhizium robertsii TaxID=568076 RepID=E9EM87_METRA|nr:geranylgeranyl pyrophosphate synthetase [Metarhizium robertsii ARSEF 23]EFZ04515.1 geranylgeranyl pyrophosphate synthetase [Metarhizium robertsii ARSEF 23]EXU95189.1 hypothetical protein X797_011737 [Metarhizium robertsii]
MAKCVCGRQFSSNDALIQHQDAKSQNGNSCSDGSAPSKRLPWSERWLWHNARGRDEPISIVQSHALEASSMAVSSTVESELICTYNWQECDEARIYVPGCAPRWRNNTLPITLREDKGSYFVHQNAARIPKYAFEPVFRASALLNPGFRFDNVDIVANRNSLRKLFDFCGGRVNSNFKVNLPIVKNTLFIERCEMSARELIRGSNRSGWGHNFEKAFTSFPSGADDSSGHHRVLCYSIGDLRCAVRFEVDACYDMDNAESNQVDSLLLQINALSLTESSTDRSCPPAMMPQSTAAELKSAQKPKSVGIYLPQLWFGRTPWLIIGYHTKGTFHSVKVTHTLPLFQNWEKDHQSELRRMVTLLHALRGAVRRNNGRNCTAVCEKTSNAKVIKIFQSTDRKRALPEELISQFWASTC